MEKRNIYIVYFLSIIFCFFTSEAQNINHYTNIQYIDANDGLSQGEVTSIIKDKKGFIWIATRGGLNRYDGNSIKVFQNEIDNENSLINNSIETLFLDSKGNIWIGTKSNGVTFYNPELDKFQVPNPRESSQIKLVNKRVIAIAESFNNDIWIGTWKNGLYIYNPINKNNKHLLRKRRINAIKRAKDNTMWVATDNGIFVFSEFGEQLNRLDEYKQFTSIAEDSENKTFYFGTWDYGLLEYNLKDKIFNQYNSLNAYYIKNVYRVCLDSKKNVLIGSWGNSANYFNTKTKSFSKYNLYPKKNKRGEELFKDVLCVFEDDGILWFGTNGGGICKVDRTLNQFKNTNATNLPKEPIWSINRDMNDYLWVGIKGNKNLFYSKNKEDFNKIVIPETIRSHKPGVKSIFIDNNNTVWLANNKSLCRLYKNGGSFKISPVKIRDFKTSKLVYLRQITKIYQTKSGTFWLGTQQQGLRKSVAPGDPLNQSFKMYLENERISSLLEDNKGRFWVGTYNGLKLYNYNDDNFKTFQKIQGDLFSLSSNIIINIFQDKNGIIWIATPNGLNKLIEHNDGTFTFKSYHKKDGLANSYIHAILEDKQSNLWMSTNKGITKYSKKDNSFINYNKNSGLLTNTFMEASAVKGADGTFYFGSVYGINFFKPNTIKSTNIPTVIFTDLKVNGETINPNTNYDGYRITSKSIEYSPKITLPPSKKTFSLEYSALDFFSNTSYSYKYKLEGLDTDWNPTTLQKNITYSNLNAGNYTFKVKTTNNEENIESKIAAIEIKVLPVFWKTWQAFLVYVIIFIFLLYLYKYFITKQSELNNKLELSKLERKKEEELIEIKTRFFTDIAHEFRTPLSLISGPVEVLMDDNINPHKQKGYLTTIYYHTQRLLNLVNQLLDFRKIESGKINLQAAKGNFKKFAYEIYLSFQELAESKDIKFKFKAQDHEIPLTYDRNRMEIVLCNLLSNAFKYSPNRSKIILSVKNFKPKKEVKKFPHGYCRISIKDNGSGISSEDIKSIFDRFYRITNLKSNHIGTGIGLALVKQIVELHKGDITVKSELDKGSEFIVKLPLGDTHFSKQELILGFKKAEDPIHYKVERILKEETNYKPKKNEGLKSLLIVEDNIEIRSFIKTIFKSTYNIIEADNGKNGLEKVIASKPDIIITDLMMPIMDGIALCKQLKEKKDTMHIPIIMLTARTKTVFLEEGYGSGADIYVTKPFNPKILKAQAEGLLNNRIQLKDYFSKKITLQPTDVDISSYDEKFLNDAIKIVEDNLLNENLNRDFLAQKLSMSPSTLYRKIKALTEKDTTIFIRSIRLKRAAQLLQKKQDNVSSIGYSVGFNDLKYFRKCFKTQFGVTPSKFNKK